MVYNYLICYTTVTFIQTFFLPENQLKHLPKIYAINGVPVFRYDCFLINEINLCADKKLSDIWIRWYDIEHSSSYRIDLSIWTKYLIVLFNNSRSILVYCSWLTHWTHTCPTCKRSARFRTGSPCFSTVVKLPFSVRQYP